MKILFLCKKFPYPPKEGEPIAIDNLSKSLVKEGCTVSLFVLNTSKHYFDPHHFPKDKNHYDKIYSVKVNNDITVTGAVLSFLKGESYILSRFYSKEYELKLAEILMANDFDVVQLETIYMAHYIPTIRAYSDAVISIRAHNVENVIWNRVGEMSKNCIKKYYLKQQNKTLRKFELSVINNCDLLVVCAFC